MSNTIIQLRHSYVTGNVPSSLANGEIAINTYDGKLFYRGGASNTIQTIERYEGPAGLDGEIQFNDSGVLGSDSDLTYNKTTDVLSVKNVVISGNSYFGNANLHEGITQLSVTNNGASAYLFDQYSGNNPSLYVGAGETISFNLNVSGHPFVIRESSGGANTSAGLTHISTTGVVTTGADAQGKVSGVLFWKVPFSLVGNTYVYQCTIHGGMVGNIVIQQPASFVASNTALAFNTANAAFIRANNSIDANNGGTITGNLNITGTLIVLGRNLDAYANAAFLRANNSLNANTGGNVTGDVTVVGELKGTTLKSTQSSGDEGGQLDLATAATNSTLLGGVVAIDVYQNKLRIFEGGGTNRGVFIDLANSASAGVGTDLLNPTATPDTIARAQANAAFITANAAFIAANNTANTNLTQNNSITAAFTAANSAGVYANGAFARANNSLNANTGGTITANVTISANLTAANVSTQTYIQFGDGSKQYTANAGGGGGSTSSFGTFAANGGAIIATTSNTEVTFVGEAGISVTSNTVTKKLTFSAPAGYTFTTADYGFVYEDTNVIYDYGTL